MKNFIVNKDKNKIVNCDANRAKMNILEFIIYIDQYSYFTDLLRGFKEGLKGFCILIMSILGVLLFPVFLFIRAFLAIKRSKKEVNYWNSLKKGN